MGQGGRNRARAPEPPLPGDLADPRALGLQIDVGAVLAAGRQVGRGDEVAEVQLPDLALDPHAQLVDAVGAPGRQHPGLGVEEAALDVDAAALGDARDLHPRAGLDRQFRARPPDGLAGRLAPQLLDLHMRRADVDRGAIDAVADVAVQDVVGALEAALQRQGLRAAVLELAAQDALAGLVALAIDLGAPGQGQGRAIGLVAQVLQEHQLQVGARTQPGVVAGAELASPLLAGFAAVLAAGTRLVPGVDDVAIEREVRDLAVEPDLAARRRALDRAARLVVLDLVVALDGFADRRAAVGEAGHPRSAVEGLVGAVDRGLQRALDLVDPVAARGLELQQRAEQAVGIEVGLDVGDRLDLHGRLDHHIGQDRLALHVDARRAAADQLHALDGRGRDALEDVFEVLALGGGALAVDQHVAGRAGEAAGAVAAVQPEAGQAGDHVEGGAGALLGEEVGRIAGDPALGLGRRRRGGRFRRGRRRGRLGFGRGQSQGEDDGSKTHDVAPQSPRFVGATLSIRMSWSQLQNGKVGYICEMLPPITLAVGGFGWGFNRLKCRARNPSLFERGRDPPP